MAANRNDVVATISRWVIDGLMLAHEGEGDRAGDAAKGTRVRANVDEVPSTGIGQAGTPYGLRHGVQAPVGARVLPSDQLGSINT